MRVEGLEHVPGDGPAILASNHLSFCDSIFLPLVLRRRITFVAKAEYFEDPKTAWFFRAVGQIPIKRGGGPAAKRALDSARDVLDDGRRVRDLSGGHPLARRPAVQGPHRRGPPGPADRRRRSWPWP